MIQTSTEAERLRGALCLTAGALLWGTVGVASKAAFALEPVTALSLAFYRLFFCLPLLLAWGWWRFGPRLLAVRREHRGAVLLLAGTIGLYQVFYFAAVREVGVTLATLVALGGAPFLVALLAALFLGERPNRATLAALLLAVPGAALLIGLPGGAAGPGSALLGTLYAAASALGYAAFALQSRRLARSYAPVQLVLLAFGGAAVLILPLALATGLSVPGRWETWSLLVYAGLLPTAAAYMLFFAGLRHATATLAGLLTVLEPLSAAVLAWLIFDERLGPGGLAGGGLILAALLLVSAARRRGTSPGASS